MEPFLAGRAWLDLGGYQSMVAQLAMDAQALPAGYGLNWLCGCLVLHGWLSTVGPVGLIIAVNGQLQQP